MKTIPIAFEVCIRVGVKCGFVYASEEVATAKLNGLIVMVKCDRHTKFRDWLSAGGLHLVTKMGVSSFTRMVLLEQELEAAEAELRHRALLPKEYYVVRLLGVEPHQKNKGIGTALMQAVIEREQLKDQTIYLTSFSPDNRGFYIDHLGFQPVFECRPKRDPSFVTFVLDRGETLLTKPIPKPRRNEALPIFQPPDAAKKFGEFVRRHARGK